MNKITLFFATLCFTVSIVGCNKSSSWEAPSNDYQDLSCEQYINLLSYTDTQLQAGKSAQEIYNSITPAEASVRMRLMHATHISTFAAQPAETHRLVENSKKLLIACEQTQVPQKTSTGINNICSIFALTTPDIIATRDSTGKNSEDELIEIMYEPIKAIFLESGGANEQNNALLLSQLKLLLIDHVHNIYLNPEKTAEEISTEWLANCNINP